MDHADILDIAGLLARYRGRQDMVRELYQAFVEDLPARLERFEKALAGEDLSALEHEAHALKGACGTVFAHGLREMAADLEIKAKQGRIDEYRELWGLMRAGLDELARAMAAY